MPAERPFVLSIAGFDPSAGAGLLADIKTFEQHQVYGLGVCSALTVQNDTDYLSTSWISASEIIKQLEPLITKFAILAIKIGLINSLYDLYEVLIYIRQKNENIRIIFDPILKASAGFQFHGTFNADILTSVLKLIDLLTPNYLEMAELESAMNGTPLASITNVLLKGGHNLKQQGTDLLIYKGNSIEIPPVRTAVWPKHGSGCMLSAAIVSNLAKGYTMPNACMLAKAYTEHVLSSNHTLLGYHNL